MTTYIIDRLVTKKHGIKMKNTGLTMLEILVTLAVITILVAAAVPGFRDYQQRLTLKHSAENFINDIRLAKSEAIKTNARVYISFTSGTSWCYGISNTNSCSCSTSGSCQLSGATLVNNSQNYNGVSLSVSGTNASAIYFSGPSGIINDSATFLFSNKTDNIQIDISNTGTISSCSATATGYIAC